MAKKLSSRGFTPVGVIVAVIVAAAVIAGGWYVWHNNKTDTKAKAANKSSTSQAAKATKTPADPYAGWHKYSSQDYGVTFKYPATWKVEGGVIDAPAGADPQEFAANLMVNIEEKYNTTAAFEVHTNNLAAVTQYYDGYFAQSSLNQVSKQSKTLKGKTAVAYDVTNSGVHSKVYLFDAGAKTYSFRSLNEELNLQRSASYWTDFDRVFDTLTIN